MIRSLIVASWRAAAAALLAVTLVLICHPATAATKNRFQPAAATQTDWLTYQHDNARSGFQPSDPAINGSTVGTLAPKWIFRANDTVSSQAIAANGLIYWGSWDGLEHATNPSTGADVWTTYLGDETKADCSPPHLGVASTATVAPIKINGKMKPVLFVGGGNGSYYALDASTGKIIWSKSFGSPQQGYFMWSSPALYNGSIYIGISSIGDCPLVPGQLVKLNASSGAQQAIFSATPPGCPGAGIWTSPTIDESTGDVYVSTGTDGGGFCGQSEPYAQAMLQLTKNLSLISSWKPSQSEQIIDGDFGGTPTLFSATINGVTRKLVGAANKNGIFYAFNRSNVGGGPVWESQPISTDDDTIASSAWDGNSLYVAGHDTVINGTSCESNIRSINPSTGAFIWSDCLSGGGAEGAVTAVPGVIFEGLGSILYAVDSATGQVVFKFQDTSFHWFYSPAMISNGALYIGNSDGNFYKFTPGGQ
jgi:outer membrane protein assembly factor BamB